MSYSSVDDWPAYVTNKLDTSGPFLSSGITYMNTFWDRLVSNGTLPDWVFIDEEAPRTHAQLRGLFVGQSESTTAATAGSWSSGTATLTIGSGHGLEIGDTVVVDGFTPSAYNGAPVLTASDDSGGTIGYARSSDPGAVTVLGSVYTGRNTATPQMYTMALNDSASAAVMPQARIKDIVVASDFASNSNSGTAASNWSPWMAWAYSVQHRKLIYDTAEARMGYRPRGGNFAFGGYSFDNADTDSISQHIRRPSGALPHMFCTDKIANPNFYFDRFPSAYSGDSKDQDFAAGINHINRMISVRRSGFDSVIWFATASTNVPSGSNIRVKAEFAAQVYKFIYMVSGKNEKWFMFNHTSTTNHEYDVYGEMFDEFPSLQTTPIDLPYFDDTASRIELNGLVLDREEMDPFL